MAITRRATVAGALAVPFVAAVPSLAPAAPRTAGSVAAQRDWVLAATRNAPLPEGAIAAHVDAAYLRAIGGAAAFNAALKQVGALTAGTVIKQTDTSIEQVTYGSRGNRLLGLTVTDAGLIGSVQFAAYPDAPRSWAELDRRARALAPDVSFAATRFTGGHPTLRYGIAPHRPHPLGSAFKLYVLGALADAVATGAAGWQERLAIRDDWKSLPSGVLQTRPAGTRLSLTEYARYMISISDNTAADHLIHRLGRPRVETSLVRLGNADPHASLPFLTTRELFALKGYDYPTGATRYRRATVSARRARLAELDRVDLDRISAWKAPRQLDAIEWYGSPLDMARALGGLWHRYRRAGMAPIGAVMSVNDGGIGLDPARYPTVWFKGGSEPGVLTLTYLSRTADGALVCASLLLTDRTAALDEATLAPEALAILRGALQLA